MRHVKYLKVDDVQDPAYQTGGAVAFDLEAAVDTNVPGRAQVRIPSGLVVQVPEDMGLLVVPRSSTFSKFGLIMPHSVGVIDQDYCGHDDEILLQVYNIRPATIHVPAGTRLAQGMFIPVAKVQFVEAASIEAENRGGFGSTG